MSVKKMAVLLVSVILLAAAPALSETDKSESGAIQIDTVTCKDLMGGNDIERNVGVAFYQGYIAGRKGEKAIEPAAASELSDQVRDYCLSNPTSTLMEAFMKCGH